MATEFELHPAPTTGLYTRSRVLEAPFHPVPSGLASAGALIRDFLDVNDKLHIIADHQLIVADEFFMSGELLIDGLLAIV
jgi:hypothetical protein